MPAQGCRLGPSRRRAIGEVVGRCRLAEVENRIIGQLSRGYRQRVGLAEAMLHDPEILILDEPTSGLDPLQIREVRDLIRELGERHTILLSTHILPEVEAVCGRVIIIASGRIALDDALANLERQGRDRAGGAGPSERSGRRFRRSPASIACYRRDRRRHLRRSKSIRAAITMLREAISQKVVSNGWPLRRLDLRRSTLEERFAQAVTEDSRAEPDREAV